MKTNTKLKNVSMFFERLLSNVLMLLDKKYNYENKRTDIKKNH